MKKIILLITIIFTLIFSVGCETEDKKDTSLDDVLEKGFFVLGLDATFIPLGFRNENGDITGFDIEVAKAVADELGIELRIQPIEWDSKVMELNSGNIDLIWNGLTITEERKGNINFSKPYLNNRQVLIVLNTSDIDKKEDLKEKKIGVQLQSSGQIAVESDLVTYNSLNELVKFSTFNEALLDLESGRIDGVVIDEIMGRYVIKRKPNVFKVASDDFGEEEYGIGFRKGEDTFRDKVDEILDQIWQNGKAKEISEKWFGEDIYKR